MDNSIILEIEGIVSGYGDIEILHGVSLHVGKGEIVGIIGPNGAGKSTIFRTAFGLIRPSAGDIRLLGSSIVGARPREILDLGLAYVPQGRFSFSEMTVEENLEMSLFIKKGDIKHDIDRIYSRFPILYEKRKAKAKELSGGMQQLMEIAGMLLLKPRLMMLDEPSLGLAPKVTTEIYDRVTGLNSEGIDFLIIEQNVNALLRVAKRIYVLELGQNRFEGTPDELLKDRMLSTIYFGDHGRRD